MGSLDFVLTRIARMNPPPTPPRRGALVNGFGQFPSWEGRRGGFMGMGKESEDNSTQPKFTLSGSRSPRPFFGGPSETRLLKESD